MSRLPSQITSVLIVYTTICSGADQRKYQSSATLAFVRGFHWRPANSLHKGPVMRKMFPFHDIIMAWTNAGLLSIGPFRIHLSKVWIKIWKFSLKKIHLKIWPSTWQPFCSGLNLLNTKCQPHHWSISRSSNVRENRQHNLDNIYTMKCFRQKINVLSEYMGKFLMLWVETHNSFRKVDNVKKNVCTKLH